MIPMAPGFFKPQSSSGYIGVNPILWFDSSDATKISVNGSNEIESITCKVTSTVWSQGTAANRPLLTTTANLSNNVMDFHNDGSNKYLTGAAISIPVPFTAFIVVEWLSSGVFSAVGLFGANATNSVQGVTGQPIIMVYSTISGSVNRNMQIYMGGDYNSSIGATSSNPAVAIYNVPDDTAANTDLYWHNSIQTDSASAGTYGSPHDFITLGSTDNTYISKGYVGEVIIYPVLTSDQRDSVFAALLAKWIP